MPQELYVLAVLDGLSYAALLFLVALGMTLVFGVMNIINMAHGSFYALGGYMAASLGLWASSMGASPAWSLLILPVAAIIVGCVFGGLMETSLMQRIYSKDPILQLLVTFSAFMIFEDLQRLVWGTQRFLLPCAPSSNTAASVVKSSLSRITAKCPPRWVLMCAVSRC